ncbi:MAG: hypothetical protein PHW63_04345 [Alphaproteobacteria bacterium]|nr:hypothetical protein [Alphaproteobacteria bacterium]
MSTENHHKVLQTQIIAQWITSLAISVICCAILFIVFAGYIVKLQESNNLLTVKIEYLEERYKTLADEVARVHRAPQIVQIMARPPVSVGEAPMAVPTLLAPDEAGMLPAPAAPAASAAPTASGGAEPKAAMPHAPSPSPETFQPAPVEPKPSPVGDQTSVKTRPPLTFESMHPAVMPAPSATALSADTAIGKGHPSAGIEEGIVVPADSEQVDAPATMEPSPAKSRNFTTKSSPQ